jgi:hypothetical protein
MIQTLLQAWLVKRLMILPMWLLMAIGAFMLVRWILERKKDTV